MNTAMCGLPGRAAELEGAAGFRSGAAPGPASGLLACDRVGDGRMADPVSLQLALEAVALRGTRRDWLGRSLLVTAGPTREFLDRPAVSPIPAPAGWGCRWRRRRAARRRGDPAAWAPGAGAGPAGRAATGGDHHRCRTGAGVDASAAGGRCHRHGAAVADHRRVEPLGTKLTKQELEQSLRGGWSEVPDLLAGLVQRRARLRPRGSRSSASPPTAAMCCPRPGPNSPARLRSAVRQSDRSGGRGVRRPGEPGLAAGSGRSGGRDRTDRQVRRAHRLLDALGERFRPPGMLVVRPVALQQIHEGAHCRRGM